MVIWRGYGIMVVVFVVLGLVAGKLFAENVWGTPLPVDKRQLSEMLGMLLAAALSYGFYFFTKRHSEKRVMIDKITGKEVVLEKKHDLFFIPMKYWPIILAALGVMFFFQK